MNPLSDETKSKLIKLKENLTETKDLITPELIHDTIKLLDVDNAYYLYRNGITLDNSIDSGVAIVNVQENSPAAASGLQKGDVILEVEGTQIKNVAYFRFVLYKYSVGDKIKIKYYRNNEILETEINLTKGLDE